MKKNYSVSALRRKAARMGLRLIKIREDSSWYYQCGPFMISGPGVLLQGLTTEEANDWLVSEQSN